MPEINANVAAVQGTLRERPLPRLLQQLYRKEFTGNVVIADQTRDESVVYLRDGCPVHVCRPVDTDRLDNLLVEYGLVSAELMAQASAQVSETQRLGDVLERMGVLDHDKLAQVLKAQVTRKLMRLYFVAEGTYAVYVAPHGFGQGSDLALMRVDPRSTVYPGIRAAYDLGRVTRELARLAEQRFRLAELSSSFVAALGIPPDDTTVEALRAGWMTLDDLDGITSRPLEVRSVTLALYYTDLLEREDRVEVGGESRSASSSTFGVHRASQLSNESGAVFNLGAPGRADSGTHGNGAVVGPMATSPSASLIVGTRPPPAPGSLPGPIRVPPSLPSAGPTAPVVVPVGPMPRSGPFSSPRPAQPSPAVRSSAAAPVVTSSALARPAPNTSGTRPTVAPTLATSGVPVVRAPFASQARPVAGPAASPAARPIPGPEAVRASILEMAARLDTATHFEILGVSVNASADEIDTAFVRAARQFHPDRLTGAGLSDLRPTAERILSRINEAAMVLGSPSRRAEYSASLTAGSQTAQNLPTLLEAENAFLKGEVFLKKGDHAHAIECFAFAAKHNPGEPQYQAYQAWARFEDPRARKEALVRETLKAIADVVKERPKFARGYYWVGQLWKFLNEGPKAEQAFREAVQIDPSFIEASRELRLIEMRKGKNPPKPESKGRFWKR